MDIATIAGGKILKMVIWERIPLSIINVFIFMVKGSYVDDKNTLRLSR